MKRRILSGMALSSFFISLVSAANTYYSSSYYFDDVFGFLGQLLESALRILSPVFEIIIGDYSTSEFFLSKVLLLILLIIILKRVVETTPFGENNSKLSWLISVLVSVISIRFINENDFFEMILLQYGVVGIAITAILPLLIFFYFIERSKVGTYGRKIMWAIYVIIMLGIWISRYSEISNAANWIYISCIAAAFIFIGFDASIHKYFGLSEIRGYQKIANKKRIRELLEDLEDLEKHFTAGRVPHYDYRKEKTRIQKNIRELSGDV